MNKTTEYMNKTTEIYGIIGAGGFGREIMPIALQMVSNLRDSNSINYELIFVVENLKDQIVVNGHEVISLSDFISLKSNNKFFNIAIADYKARERISKKLIDSNIQPFTIKASNVVILDNNEIGEGAVLCPFTTITSNVKIGNFFHLNIYSYIAHDCVIGNFVTFAPNVNCNGNVVIEDYAYIGTGAIIKQGTNKRPVIIGKGAVVGMGAVVTKSVPEFTTVIGNPAVVLKNI